jgi:uncharacterized protein YneF (UPF0154 family)
LQQVSLDWWLTLAFLGLALVGMFGGLFVAEKVPGEYFPKPLVGSSSCWRS